VEDEVDEGVGERFDAAFGEFCGDVFYARDGIDVGAFAAEEFEYGLHLD